MTKQEIYLALVLGVVGNLLTWIFFQPLLKRLKAMLFDSLLAANSRIMTAFYTKVARRDTSHVMVIVHLAMVFIGLFFFAANGFLSMALVAVGSQYKDSTTDTIVVMVLTYGLIGFWASSLMLTMTQQALRIYDTIRTQVRPDVDEEFLIELDSQFASVSSKADFDTVITSLKNGHVTHPRTTAR